MSSLDITFRGLVGLVPKRTDPTKTPDGAVLVMPDVSLGSARLPDELPGPMPPHTACLVLGAELVDRCCSDRSPDFEFRRGGFERYLYLLNRENVRLLPRSKQPLELLDNLLLSREDPPTEPAPGEENDLSWIPNLARSELEDAGVFDRDLLDRSDRPKRPIIGSFTVDGGKVSSRGVRRDGQGRAIVYQFRPLDRPEDVHCDDSQEEEVAAGPSPPVFAQAMSTGVRLLVDLPERGAVLQFSHRKRGETGRIALRLPEGFPAPLRFFNLELEEILGIGSASPLIRKVADPDYAAFYPLSAGWKKFKGEPLPIPHIQAGGRGQVNCEPPRFGSWRSSGDHT